LCIIWHAKIVSSDSVALTCTSPVLVVDAVRAHANKRHTTIITNKTTERSGIGPYEKEVTNRVRFAKHISIQATNTPKIVKAAKASSTICIGDITTTKVRNCYWLIRKSTTLELLEETDIVLREEA
jgi:hypothetical protein